MRLLERIRDFQKFLYQTGLAQGTLALPAPSLLALPNPSASDIELDLIFDRFIDEFEIVQVSRVSLTLATTTLRSTRPSRRLTTSFNPKFWKLKCRARR